MESVSGHAGGLFGGSFEERAAEAGEAEEEEGLAAQYGGWVVLVIVESWTELRLVGGLMGVIIVGSEGLGGGIIVNRCHVFFELDV